MIELIIFLSLGLLIYLLFLLRDKKQKEQDSNPLPANGVETPYIASPSEETPSEETTNSLPANGVETSSQGVSQEEGDECCGQHLVCERDSLLTQNANIEYYDDEELDVLSGLNPDDYTDEQVQMLQEVFYTLRESDVAGWVRSLQMRNIALTPELRDEALLIVRERRTSNK